LAPERRIMDETAKQQIATSIGQKTSDFSTRYVSVKNGLPNAHA
jgi:hypothetical protein